MLVDMRKEKQVPVGQHNLREDDTMLVIDNKDDKPRENQQ